MLVQELLLRKAGHQVWLIAKSNAVEPIASVPGWAWLLAEMHHAMPNRGPWLASCPKSPMQLVLRLGLLRLLRLLCQGRGLGR